MNLLRPLSLLIGLASILFVACPITDSKDGAPVLNIQVDRDNDSLLTYDTLIITVYSKDSSFSQEVFHRKLTDPKQVMGIPLDPRVGKEFHVSIVGIKDGKVAMQKEVTILGPNKADVKNIPLDTVRVDPNLPELSVQSDASVAEGDSLRLLITIQKQWQNGAVLVVENPPVGSGLDTSGLADGKAYFTWRPSYSQGKSSPYSITLGYSKGLIKVQKTFAVQVTNTNRPPKLSPVPDKIVKEGETLSFRAEATDPDGDSLSWNIDTLPSGATFAAGAFTWKPTVGQKGNYSFRISVSDGQETEWVPALITVGDTTPPPSLSVVITKPASDTLVNSTPILITYKVNETVHQRSFPLKDGRNKIYIDTTVQGRTAFDTVVVTLDTVAPGRPVVTGKTPVNTRTPTWTWKSGGGGSSNYRYQLDNEALSAPTMTGSEEYTSPKDLDPGSHTLYVQERDWAGNWSAIGKFAIRIDTARPAPPTLKVQPSSPTNNVRPTWTWQATGDDISGNFRYKLGDGDFRNGAIETKGLTFTPPVGEELKEGQHTLFVQQQDSAGNWSNSASADVRIDLTPPLKPKIVRGQPSPTNLPRPSWSWSSGGNGMGVFRFTLDDSAVTAAQEQALLLFTASSDLKSGPHRLYVQERDSAGNWSPISIDTMVVDLLPPSKPILDTLPSPLNTLQPTWTWKQGGGGNGTFRCRLADTLWTKGADTIGVKSFKPPSALSEGMHTLFVQERDSAGNWSLAASQPVVLALRGLVGAEGMGDALRASHQVFMDFNAGAPFLVIGDYYTMSGKNLMLTTLRFTGSKWDTLDNRSISSSVAQAFSISRGINNDYFAAFCSPVSPNFATVLRFSGATWDVANQSALQVPTGYSIAADRAGNPVMAFQPSGAPFEVDMFNGHFWSVISSAPFPATVGSFFELAYDGSGNAIVGFEDSAGNAAAMICRNRQWSVLGNGTFPIGAAGVRNVDFALSPYDEPYFAFSDAGSSQKATVIYFDGAKWTAIGSRGFSDGSVSEISLAFDGSSRPSVAFADGANGNRLTVMASTLKGWRKVGPSGFSRTAVTRTSIRLNQSNVPYVAFSDEDKRTTVLRASYEP